jgi:hypothetical protein
MPNASELARKLEAEARYEGPDHYFASCALGWATAKTRAEAIDKMIRGNCLTQDVKRITANMQKKGEPGFYLWTCRVHGPDDADYRIEWFQPKGIEWSESRHHDVTYITGKQLAYTTRKGDIK